MSDYSNIQQELDDFLNATYGEEVRSALVSAIKKIYDIADTGLSSTEKQHILTLFSKSLYKDGDALTAYNALHDLWSDYSVTWSGVGYVAGNSASRAGRGETYTSTVTASSGYSITTVSVTMGGVTVAGAYSAGTVTIPSVTGDVVITVTTTQSVGTLLYDWDLTSSLTDSVGGITATLIGNVDPPTQSASGVSFSAAAQGIYFGQVGDMSGKTLEYDVSNAVFAGSTSYHIRHTVFANSTASSAYGTSPFVWKSGTGWSAYGMSASSGTTRSWASDVWGTLSGSDASVLNCMSGKTVKVVFSADASSFDLYLDSTFIGTKSGIYFDTRTKHLYFGSITEGLASKGDQCYDMTLTGLRIYQN